MESIHRVGKTFLWRKDHYGVARSLITLGSSTRDVSHFHEAAKIMVRDNAVKSALKCFECPLLISVHQSELQLIPKGHCQFKSINFYWFGCGRCRYSESRQGAGSTLVVDAQKYYSLIDSPVPFWLAGVLVQIHSCSIAVSRGMQVCEQNLALRALFTTRTTCFRR